MAQYGGHEDYGDITGRLAKAEDAVDGLVAKEKLYQRELDTTTNAERQSTAVRREGAEVRRRTKAVEGTKAQDTEIDTRAIERNTAARRRQNEEIRRSQVNTARAARGANDPAFGRAYELAQERGGTISQYALRRAIPSGGPRGGMLGSERAQDITAALGGGFRPGGAGATQPRTRTAAAELQLETAEARLVQATNDLTNARRRKSVTEGEREQLLAARQSAKASRDAAKLELESSVQEAEARRENAAAARREATMRKAAADSYVNEVLTNRPQQLALPAAGQTAQMRQSTAQVFTKSNQPVYPNRPGVVAEGGVVGQGAPGVDRELSASRAAASAKQTEAAATRNAARAAAELRSANLAQYYDQAEAHSRGMTQAVTRQGVAFGTTSQAMYKHGALTSEFIAAAARGETTLRELGNQALLTAGKFGGWTAAATAVYGVGAAIAKVGQGAIQAFDGAQQLTRVITEDMPSRGGAAGQIADLAQQFNVPIDVASDAVYRMGQRFHSFPAAVSAARASLYSFKTGEVDVASSTQNLIGIVNGFGLSNKELTSVYDQINQAQNVFGVKIGDTEAGMAKAAGTYRNAGGDLDYLLGLMVAINRATGRPGNEIGTGIARGVNEITKPGNQLKLRNLGVEVDPTNFQKTLQSALQVAARNPGANKRELATGLFGNQYARLIAPVLSDQTTLNNALKDLTPEKSKGSAQRELAKVLKETREQVAALGIGLQALGEGLAEAGAFTPLAAMLKLLASGLTAVNSLVDAFNHLPTPIRQAITLLGEAYVLLQAMRRLGATDRFIGGALGGLANPDKRLQVFAKRGLRDARGLAYNEVERSAAGTFRASQQAAIASQRVTAFRPELLAAQKLPIDSEERAATEAKATALAQQQQAAQAKYIAAERETLEMKRLALGLDTQLAEVSALQAAKVREYLVANQIPIPRELAAPNMRGVTHVSPANADVAKELEAQQRAAEAAGVRGANLPAGARLAAGTPRSLGKLSRSMEQRVAQMSEHYVGAFALGLEQMGTGMVGANSQRVLNSAAQRTGRIAVGATRVMGGTATALKNARGSLAGLAGGLGLIDGALIAFIGLEFINSELDKRTAEASKRIDDITSQGKTQTGERDRLRTLASRAQQYRERAPRQNIEPGSGSIGDQFRLLRQGATGLTRGQGIQTQRSLQRSTEAELQNANDVKALQQHARDIGRPVPLLYRGELIGNIKADQEQRKQGIISQQEFDNRMRLHAEEALHLANGTKKNVQAAKAAIAAALSAQGGSKDYAASLRQLDDKGLTAEIEATTGQVSAQGLTPRNMQRMQAQYQEAQRRYAGKSDAASVKAMNAARNSYYSTLTQEVQRELQAALLGASNESERRAAFARAREQYREAEGNVQRQRAEKPDRTRARATSARARAEALDRPTAGRAGADDDAPDAIAAQQLDHMTAGRAGALAQAAKKITDRTRKVKEHVKRKDRELRQAELELKNAAYEDRLAGLDIQAELESSRTDDPSQQAAIKVRFASQKLRIATRTWARGSRQYKQALTALNQARQDQAEQIRQDANQIASLNAQIVGASLKGDDVAGARALIQAAHSNAGRAKTPVEKLQSRLDVINANNQLDDAIRDREQARYDLLASQTEDPVKQAKIHRDQARAGIAGTRGAERTRAQANYNQAQTAYRNARIDSRLETINFNLEMDKITADEAARQITDLANTKGIARQKRRELLLQAKQLRDQDAGEGELNIGSIKLPSLAEVRRAVLVGGNSAHSNVTNNNNVNMYVDGSTNMDELGRTLDSVLGTNGLASSRTMGVGG
jgi:hypothetical protein